MRATRVQSIFGALLYPAAGEISFHTCESFYDYYDYFEARLTLPGRVIAKLPLLSELKQVVNANQHCASSYDTNGSEKGVMDCVQDESTKTVTFQPLWALFRLILMVERLYTPRELFTAHSGDPTLLEQTLRVQLITLHLKSPLMCVSCMFVKHTSYVLSQMPHACDG